MDILFSPYSLGGVPRSAMAEIERRTEDLLKSSSFQRMLELEKKHKMERLRGVQALLPSSQLYAQRKEGPPPRPERPDIGFPQEEFLMVKAARCTVITPSLSITIPQSADHERRVRPQEEQDGEPDEDHADAGTPTASEPFQKQVKFLAPEDDGDDDEDGDEDGMSEQSSICQSPSWEGYGQRKKEKKREAERRKREKEQAEKEARAAKKRASARLSKQPPPMPATARTANRHPTAIGLTNADRSTSDPMLVTWNLPQGTQTGHLPQDVERIVSADGVQRGRQHRPALTGALPASGSSNGGRDGGNHAEDPKVADHKLCDSGSAPRQGLRRSMSEGPVPPRSSESSAISSSKHETRAPRDAFPPSASRTPMLRHMSPSSGNRAGNLFHGSANTNHSQESLAGVPSVDGGRRHGYVVHQRAQATERALAGLVDELVGSVAQYYPPSRSSSGGTHSTRRSSLTQEAKSAAMKLMGMRASSAARDGGNTQDDYLTFKAIPYSASDIEPSAAAGSTPTSPRAADGFSRAKIDERPSTSEASMLRGTKGVQDNFAVLDRPPTSQSSVSSSVPSITGSTPSNHTRKSRGVKDAAKAALSMPKGATKAADSSKPSVPVQSHLTIRPVAHSSASVHTGNKVSEATAEDASKRPAGASVPKPTKSAEKEPQGGGYRVSEGSSSSSAYEDGSSLPSPSTTPETSRPQSAKDIALSTSNVSEGNPGAFGLQDDERTLRQSLDSSNSTTPRMLEPEARENIEMQSEDRWSRTALPIDLDCDAQSFMTTVFKLDHEEETEQPQSLGESPHNAKKGEGETAILIPPRSLRRGQSVSEGITVPPTASSFSAERRDDAETLRGLTGKSEEQEGAIKMRRSPKSRALRNVSKPLEQAVAGEMKAEVPERYRNLRKETRPKDGSKLAGPRGRVDGDEPQTAPESPQREWASDSITPASSTVPSGPTSPRAINMDFQIPGNPYFADLPTSLKYTEVSGEIPTSAGPPSPISLPSPVHPVLSKAPSPPQANSAPTPVSGSAAPSRTSTPSGRASGMVPVSILKQPKTAASDQAHARPQTSSRPQVLSAIPKHMQLQAGLPVRPPTSVPETRMSPIAKIFVECCRCKFYHDMPSKLYECMAKPDQVVEDKLRGISGAVTTMVKCPWCQHNMSRDCCAGYAAVVYLKEKLH